ncbi:hypothetical protein HDU98_011022 [Podochytrium sp. JEL0797]|nr:hypothetical protein HDU98_011022 [Podochytrium sp. JEL0797]
MIAAALQLTTTPASLQANIATVRSLIATATSKHNANLIVLPEYWASLGMKSINSSIAEPVSPSAQPSEDPASTPLQHAMSSLAKEFHVWLVGGTIPTLSKSSTTHFKNTLQVYNPAGLRVANYDKIHLFKFAGPPAFDEGLTVEAGSLDQELDVDLEEGWRLRMSVCYDIRFPELYRKQEGAKGYNVIVVPAAFTVETGVAHWEVLLRARAVENQAYVIASAQVGTHPVTGRVTYGNSMVIDPWGAVLSRVQEEQEGIAVAELNLSMVEDHVQPTPPHLLPRKGLAIQLNGNELKEPFIKGGGKGGQKVNKSQNCVWLKHEPTGFTVKTQKTRSLLENRKVARQLMVEKKSPAAQKKEEAGKEEEKDEEKKEEEGEGWKVIER